MLHIGNIRGQRGVGVAPRLMNQFGRRRWSSGRQSSAARSGMLAPAFSCLLLIFASNAHAQTPAIRLAATAPPSPVGSGARAVGSGSAFIALADDATAASWNPGGLVQLERPEISAVGLATYQTSSGASFDDQDGPIAVEREVADADVGAIGVNYASAAVPFAVRGLNLVASLNYQQKLSFAREATAFIQSTGPGLVEEDVVEFHQQGWVYAIAPALAAEITPNLSLGAAVEHWFDGIGREYAWRQQVRQSFDLVLNGEPATGSSRSTTDFRNFDGTGGTIGVLWRDPAGLSAGAVVHLPFQAHFDLAGQVTDANGAESTRAQHLTMEVPVSYGFGVSLRPTDRLTFALDFTRVEWGDFRLIDEHGNEFSAAGDPIGADNEFSNPDDPVSPGVDATNTVRLGVEYAIATEPLGVTTRAGAFYDPEPSRGAPASFWGGSVGLGFTTERFSVDLAYQLRVGLDVTRTATQRSVLQTRDSAGVDELRHECLLSSVYYF